MYKVIAEVMKSNGETYETGGCKELKTVEEALQEVEIMSNTKYAIGYGEYMKPITVTIYRQHERGYFEPLF